MHVSDFLLFILNSYCEGKIQALVPLLLPDEQSDCVKQTSTEIATRLSQEKVHSWINKHITIRKYRNTYRIPRETSHNIYRKPIQTSQNTYRNLTEYLQKPHRIPTETSQNTYRNFTEYLGKSRRIPTETSQNT